MDDVNVSWLGIYAFSALVVLFVASVSFIIVRTGTVVLVERLGSYTRTLGPGLHFLAPLIDSVRGINWKCMVDSPTSDDGVLLVVHQGHVNTEQQQLDLCSVDVLTSDRLEASVDCTLFYRVTDPYKAVYQIDDLLAAIETLVYTALRGAICTMTLDTAISGVVPIRERVYASLKAKQLDWGFEITVFEIQKINPPDSIVKATEASVCKARDSEQRERLLEADRRAKRLEQETRREMEHAAEEAAAEKAHIHATGQQRMREVETAMLLAQAKGAAECTRLGAEAEAARYKSRRAAGMSEAHMQRELDAEAWSVLARAGGVRTMIIPQDSARFLGAGPAFYGAHVADAEGAMGVVDADDAAGAAGAVAAPRRPARRGAVAK